MLQKHRIKLLIISLLVCAAGFWGYQSFCLALETDISQFQVKREESHRNTLENKYPKIKQFWSYIPLFFDNGLEWEDITERNCSSNARSIKTAKGVEQVSVASGYRVLYKFPRTDYFAKMHVEKSQTENFEADQQKVIENLSFEAKNFGLAHSNKNDAQIYYSGQTTLSGSSVMGMAVIIYPKDYMIVTIYFLNQESNRRKFQTFEEYKNLKDKFIEDLVNYQMNYKS